MYSVRRDFVLIHNGYQNTTAVTNVTVPLENELDDGKLQLVGNLEITGHSKLIVYGDQSEMVFDTLSV